MDCPAILQVPYGAFTEGINKKITERRIPVSGSLELTRRCNVSCLHCYCAGQSHERELTAQEICRAVGEITQAGCLWLLITGGEPLLREDFIPLYRYIKQKGIFVTLYTNGTLLTPQILDVLCEYPPSGIEITLYGATQSTYEAVTGVPGSYRRCLEAIDILCERKLPLGLKTMVTTVNRHELRAMKEFAASYGLAFRFDPDINPRLDGSPIPLQYRLSAEEAFALDAEDQQRSKEWRRYCRQRWGAAETDHVFVCAAGRTLFHIDSAGNVSLCVGASFPSFSLRAYSFDKIWNTFIPRVLDKKIEGDFPCRQCELVSICGRCPGWAYLETASYQGPIAYACELAHLRAEAFGPKEEVLDEEKVREAANQRS